LAGLVQCILEKVGIKWVVFIVDGSNICVWIGKIICYLSYRYLFVKVC